MKKNIIFTLSLLPLATLPIVAVSCENLSPKQKEAKELFDKLAKELEELGEPEIEWVKYFKIDWSKLDDSQCEIIINNCKKDFELLKKNKKQ
ncbi:hypothetical protein [Mycoplasma elephantis]|uniref:hypothetical protein n=1 Tax=Mycoplasma elephantis TaxID=114882 RepID=UPI0004829CF0|nr:hypothetical protein [Mycoplasma elephantis]